MAAEGRPRSGREAPLTPSTVRASTGPVESRCVNTVAAQRGRKASSGGANRLMASKTKNLSDHRAFPPPRSGGGEPRVSAVEGESGEMGFNGRAEPRIAAATVPAELENSHPVAVTPCRRNAP